MKQNRMTKGEIKKELKYEKHIMKIHIKGNKATSTRSKIEKILNCLGTQVKLMNDYFNFRSLTSFFRNLITVNAYTLFLFVDIGEHST